MDTNYHIIIIGSGPAGRSAALYAGRAKRKTRVIEQASYGGQITSTAEIENYPGSLPDESGISLVTRMRDQAIKFGAEFLTDQVIAVDFKTSPKGVFTFGADYFAKAVIIASGASPMKLSCPGEEKLTGRGISYCATCDAAFFEGLPVYVVGGGDAAVEEAMYLTKFASEVTIIHRRDQLRAAKSIQEKAFANPKIKFMFDSFVKEFIGEDKLDAMLVQNIKTGEITKVQHDMFGVFEFIGFKPSTELYEDQLPLEFGYIKTDEEMETAVEGVFAAGDCRDKSLRQVVTAASDGAIAAVNAAKYIENL
ncbi:MAG: thioredoxin-disulfide reductase [Clostridia bacterium]|nr:thioredoxin-disulfide reductase [Clostridia bacterium]